MVEHSQCKHTWDTSLGPAAWPSWGHSRHSQAFASPLTAGQAAPYLHTAATQVPSLKPMPPFTPVPSPRDTKTDADLKGTSHLQGAGEPETYTNASLPTHTTHTYTYVSIYTHTHTHIHTCMSICTHASYTSIHKHTHVYKHTCIMCIHTYTNKCAYAQANWRAEGSSALFILSSLEPFKSFLAMQPRACSHTQHGRHGSTPVRVCPAFYLGCPRHSPLSYLSFRHVPSPREPPVPTPTYHR